MRLKNGLSRGGAGPREVDAALGEAGIPAEVREVPAALLPTATRQALADGAEMVLVNNFRRDRAAVNEYYLAYEVAAKQYNLPILVMLLDNTGWSAVKESTLRVFPQGTAKATDKFQAGLMPDAEFIKIGEAFGAHGEKVVNPDDLPAALKRCVDAVRVRQGRQSRSRHCRNRAAQRAGEPAPPRGTPGKTIDTRYPADALSAAAAASFVACAQGTEPEAPPVGRASYPPCRRGTPTDRA